MNHKGLHIQVIRTLEELEPYAGSWNDLAFQSPHPLPDPSHAWIASYLEHQLEAGERWFCLLAFDGSTLVGVLPVILSPFKPMGLKGYKFRTPYNDQTASVDFLVEPSREKEIIPYFLKQLSRMGPNCFSFEMRRLPENSPTLGIVKDGLKGFFPALTFDGHGSFVKIEGTFEDYKLRLGTKYTRNLRRLERKFLALPGAKISFLTGKDLTDQELARFMRVETLSWKCARGSALCQCDSLEVFYKTLTERLTDLGWLEWHFLEAEGRTIAAHLAIRVNRSLIILKICYDETYALFSPGTILFEKMFERAFESGEVDEVNLLTDYAWNQNWQVEKRSYFNVHLFPHRPLPLLAGYLPLKIRLGLRQVPAIRQISNFCFKCLEGVHPKNKKKTGNAESDP